jgi:hypothetical protein
MVEGVNSSMIYFTYCKNLCNCHNVPPPSTITMKKRKTKDSGTKEFLFTVGGNIN